jgi:DNA repair protein RadA/Sms
MAKTKTQFTCQACGAISPKWAGQCPDCGAWNSFVESIRETKPAALRGYAGTAERKAQKLSEVAIEESPRIGTASPEFDRVLGGGLVLGSVVLLGGDPGIGKSTLLLQTLANLSQQHATLYITGEESLQQVALRANRLEVPTKNLTLLAETQIETITQHILEQKPQIVVVDSIQTIYTNELQAAPGSVSQVRESTAALVRLAKQENIAFFLVGHVTKEGSLAGPRVLEHMVDTVLYFEGDPNHRFRIVRATKNRFGAVNELGVFAMTDRGLKEVSNPSAIFLSHYQTNIPGSAIMVSWEGSRPLLIEVQALVDESHTNNPRRVAVGLDYNRLAMLLAILHRHGGIATYNQDVFVNVVGGVKIAETSADLPTLLAIISSLRNKPLPEKLISFGEVGLAGEIRPVQSGQDRLKDAVKHGFEKALIPRANAPKQKIPGLEVIAIDSLQQAIDFLRR